jgi:hypothetical protein
MSMFEELYLEAGITQHLETCGAAIDHLCAAHAALAQAAGEILAEESAWTAIWEMTGRCLSLSRAFLDQLSHGFVLESLVTARAIHEACMLVAVFVSENDTADPLWPRWLRDEWIPPSTVQKRYDRIEARLQEQMRARGIQPLGRLRDPAARLYDALSAAAHSRRSGVASAVSPGLPRTFAYGPHPGLQTRASHVSYGTTLIIHVVQGVGNALTAAVPDGAEFNAETVQPLLDQLRGLYEGLPLDSRGLRPSAGGTSD